MKVVFDPSFDGGAWPGPLQNRDAVVGELWVGPAGLLGLLETHLGLGGPQQSNRARASALIPAVRGIDGFWSRSAVADVLATARTLLGWRDHLWLSGWRGEAGAPRLAQLAQVTADVMPGVPDRLVAVLEHLETHRTSIETITCFDDPDGLPALWRRILQRLAGAGTDVSVHHPEPAPSRGDLCAARFREFAPEGDGTLQMVRPYGPLAAAEEVSAWIAAQPRDDGVVVIGPDPVLDAALRRHGVPVTGARESHGDNSLLQLLPLTLAMAWSPPDPRRALELLTLPECPIPKAIRRGLIDALNQWPAIDSDAWRHNLESKLSRLEDVSYREAVSERVKAIFSASTAETDCSRAEIGSRASLLARWLRARAEREEDDSPKWSAALAQCDEFIRLVKLSGLDTLSAPQLQRFVDSATSAAGVSPAAPAEAGIHRVTSPGAIVGPAEHIVWWSFTQRSAPSVATLPLSARERAVLLAAGVELPDPGRIAVGNAIHWRRPLLQATDHLLLVCPQHTADGEEEYPHPLWDELIANAVDDKLATKRLVNKTARFSTEPIRRQRRPLELPIPVRQWAIPTHAVRRREQESPTSVENLLRCGFKWVLEYCGRVRAGSSAQLPAAEKLIGRVVHEIMGTLLANGPTSSTEAEIEAGRLFDKEGPRLAAVLFLPGADAARGQARRIVTASARDLFGLVEKAGLNVVAVETDFEGIALGGVLRGRPDLVVGPPTTIIDLKHGGEKYRLAELEAGTALQLAAYSRIVSDESATPAPHVAFYILQSQRLLALSPSPFSQAEAVHGPGAVETWDAVQSAHRERWTEIDCGTLIASGIAGDDGTEPLSEDAVIDGSLVLSPSCRFCTLGALCGKAFGGGL